MFGFAESVIYTPIPLYEHRKNYYYTYNIDLYLTNFF